MTVRAVTNYILLAAFCCCCVLIILLTASLASQAAGRFADYAGELSRLIH